MDFANLRQDKALKTSASQKGMNLLPSWAYARTAEYSNMQSMYGDLATELGDLANSMRQEASNQTATRNNMWYLGDVYAHVIPDTFVFQYNDLRDSLEYIAPNVTGAVGADTFNLQEVHNQDQGYLFKGVPSDVKDVDLPELNTLSVQQSYLITLPTTTVDITVPYDNHVIINAQGLAFDTFQEGVFNPPVAKIKNKRYPEQEYEITILANGICYRTAEVVPAGEYEVEVELATTGSYYVYVYPLSNCPVFPELAQEYYGVSFRSPYRWQVDPDDESYVTVKTPPSGRPEQMLNNDEPLESQKSFVMLNSSLQPEEHFGIAGPDYMPVMFALSKEQANVIHVYDRYFDQPKAVHTNNGQPLLDLQVEAIDWRIGDDIEISTRRKAAFMDSRITAVRLSIEHEFEGTTSTTYYDSSGSASTASLSWVPVDQRLSDYKDQRWIYSIAEAGTHKAILDVRLLDGTEVSTASYIFHVGYKKPLATLAFTLGKANIGTNQIGLWADGCLYVRNYASDVYKLPLIYNDVFIDYDEYIAYTLTDFDSLTLTY